MNYILGKLSKKWEVRVYILILDLVIPRAEIKIKHCQITVKMSVTKKNWLYIDLKRPGNAVKKGLKIL